MNAPVRDQPCPRCGGSSFSMVDGRSFCLSCAGERVFATDLLGRETTTVDLPAPNRDAMPQRLGDYEILEELGRGGMGCVYAARQIGLGRIVALKVIGGSGRDGAELELRFLREAQTVARLRHPHIVAVHDSGRIRDLLYFSMDYIDGGDLATRLKDRVYTPREAALLIGKMADALAYAHGEGVLHRDVKPSNILLEGEEPRLADFGLAAQLEAGGDLTARSGVLGTPHYLAVEALRGGSGALTIASDIYALGVVLFEMLTGRTPFAGASLAELASLLSEREPPSPRLLWPAVPRDLETICLKCLEREPARRYSSAADLRADLHRFVRGEPIVARPITWPNRFARWCRRKPALAAVWFLITAIAIGSTAAMLRIRSERERTQAALTQTLAAENAARERLREAKLAEPRAIRRTTIPGRRDQALAAIVEAARIRPGADLRDEAIAAPLLYDVKPIEKWNLNLGGPYEINSDPKGTVATAEARNVLSSAREPASVYRWGDAKPFTKLAASGTGAVGEMRFSRDGKFSMARYADQTLRVWRLADGQPALTISSRPLPGGERHTETFNADYDFTPDGTCVVLGLPNHGLSLHRIADGAEIARSDGGDLFHTVEMSPDGRFVAAANIDAAVDSAVYVFSLPDLRVVQKLVAPSKPGVLSWSSHSRLLAVAQRQSSFALFDIRDGRLLSNIGSSIRDSPEINFVGADDGLLALRGSNSLHLVNVASGREELASNGVGPSQLATDRTAGNFILPSIDTSVTRMAVQTPLGLNVIAPPRPAGFEILGNYFAIAATGLPPSDSRESAMVVTLPPGAFTAVLRGNNESVGVGLVEIYSLQ
jgi:hypothetical protein